MRRRPCKEIHCFYGPDKPDLSADKYWNISSLPRRRAAEDRRLTTNDSFMDFEQLETFL
jgi:hypothetical protein